MTSNPHKKTPKWEEFEQLLGQSLPFFKEGSFDPWMKHLSKLKDMSWIEKHLKEAVQQSLSANASQTGRVYLQADVFETHRSVIVRMNIPKSVNPRALQLFISTSKLRIEGLPGGKKQTISLPAPVLIQRTSVKYKDSVLEVRARKSKRKERFREIYIEF